MKKDKLVMFFVMLAIIILSIFVVAMQYQITNIRDTEKDTFFVKILADKTSGYPPFDVNFTAIVLNNEGKVKYNWDFSDGKISEEKNPKHTFLENMSFVCKLTATDSIGKKANDSINIFSKHNQQPTVTILINNERPRREYKIGLPTLAKKNGLNLQRLRSILPESLNNSPGPITCTAQADDPDGDEIVSYRWELKPPTITTLTGNDITPTFVYEGKNVTFSLLDTYVQGKYDLKLTITDSTGQSRSTSITFEIQISQLESTIGSLKWIFFTLFLGTIYDQFLPEQYKHVISDPLWIILEPIDDYLREFLNKFSGNISKVVLKMWDFLLASIETKFPKPIEKAELLCTFDNSEFDHSLSVESNGGVTNEINVSHLITIINNDNSTTAKNVYIKLKVDNKVFSGEGLDDKLEKEELEVSVTAGGETKKLFYDGEYIEGYNLGDLAPYNQFTGEFNIKLKKAKEGTFEDNKIYNCNVYVYQVDANYISHFSKPDILSFTVLT